VDEPCDVVADKDGIIESIQIKAGLGMKKAGDTVVQGDILVTGTMVSALDEVRQVHAMADVTLRTWHTLEQVMPTKETSETGHGDYLIYKHGDNGYLAIQSNGMKNLKVYKSFNNPNANKQSLVKLIRFGASFAPVISIFKAKT
jgi:hypothetical protein